MKFECPKSSLLASLFLALALVSSIATAAESGCEPTKISSSSMTYNEVMKRGGNPEDIYNSTIEKVEKIAKDNKLKSFRILSSDVSVSRSGYGNDAFDVYVSVYVEFEFQKNALNAFYNNAGASNFSFSTQQRELCD